MNLDSQASRHFTFGQFIKCGETWNRHQGSIANLPLQPATWQAIRALSEAVLDPVVDRYGSVILTYGFSSMELSAAIKKSVGRIAPARDQHAGHELNKKGALICTRLGFAVDFSVPAHNSREVAHWVTQNTAFDRLYFYGDDRPIHVSVGHQRTGQIVEMRTAPNGRRYPRVVRSIG